MEGINYLKTSQISIITKSEVRYEGTLYNINAQEKKITLSNVRSFGTEGRRPGNDLPAFNHVYDHIVFSSDDIKDLTVLQNQNEQPNAEPAVPKQEPSKPESQSLETPNVQEKKQPTQVSSPPAGFSYQQQAPQSNTNPTYQQNQKQEEDKEFDFEANNEKFKKLTLEDNGLDKKYDKKIGFFDNISNSTTEKTRETKEERIHQTQIDKETFGNSEVNQYRGKQSTHGRRGFPGGYRGNNYRNNGNRPNTGGYGGQRGYNASGRGGYQGGYSGGYGNNNNSYQKYGNRYNNNSNNEGAEGATGGAGGAGAYGGRDRERENGGYSSGGYNNAVYNNSGNERPYTSYSGGYGRGGQNRRYNNNNKKF